MVEHFQQPANGPTVDDVLNELEDRLSLRLNCYRRPTLERRLANRMLTVRTRSLGEYLELLRADPSEPDQLLARLTIKVSRFFRSASAFAQVRRALAQRAGRPLRVWSAGSSHGEEAYSLAILLEELGLADASVLATDVDPLALDEGRRGLFSAAALGELAPDLAARHLQRHAERGLYEVRPSLRRRVRFARHDLTTLRPPDGGPFDLICCRNTLIYFQRDIQQDVHRMLADALRPDGLLWLGEAEWLGGPAQQYFETVDARSRLFRRKAEGAGDSK